MARILYTIFILSLLFLQVSCKAPKLLKQDDGWEYLGQSKANHLREKDVIKIESREKYTELRLYVFERTIEIRDFEVMLINGDVLRPVIDKKILLSDRSRLIELGSEGRQLDHITIRYRSEGKLFSPKALIQFGGKRYEPR